MKKTCTLTVVLSFLSLLSWSQERIPADLAEGQFYINILSPGVAYEHKIGDRVSLNLSAGLTGLDNDSAFDIDNGDDELDEDVFASLNPFVVLGVRSYYPRKRVKKQLQKNSGNYIGITSRYNFKSIADGADFNNPSLEDQAFEKDKSFQLAGVWGMQRNYMSSIHLRLELGYGIITGANRDFGGAGFGSFTFGFTIGGKKAKMPQEWIDSNYK